MLRKTVLSLLGLTCILFATSAFAELNMQDGKWEITTKVEMKGMPMEMPATTFTQCITKKDAVPQKPEKGQDCKMTNSQISGNTVSWAVQCKSKDGTVDGNGTITYKSNSFDGTMHMTMNNPKSGKMEMNQHMTGKRIGDCK